MAEPTRVAHPGSLRGWLRHDETGLSGFGIVARNLATHRVEPVPGKGMATCRWEGSSGNTMMGIHLADIAPAGTKCDHRHLDETLTYILSGSGRTEIGQRTTMPSARVSWRPGDLVAIPANAWHRHVNADPERPARQLSFQNTALMTRVLQGRPGRYDPAAKVYNTGTRLPDRFDDEADYFTRRHRSSPTMLIANAVPGVAGETLPPGDDRLGRSVSMLHLVMGGQRTFDVAVVGIEAGGYTHPHRPLAEEALFVLGGQGRTQVWTDAGDQRLVRWRAGDLVCPPLGVWRQHHADEAARLLKVRMTAVQRALGLDVDEPGLHTTIPDRFPGLVEPEPAPKNA